jgi:hypothetical protein
MRNSLGLVFLILSHSVLSQLDEKYHGIYLSDEGNSDLAIYTLDDVLEDCFIADYTVYAPVNENGESAHEDFVYSGYGSCDGPNGHWLINLESDGRKITLEVSFSMSDLGPALTVYQGKKEINYSYMMSLEDDETASQDNEGELVYFLPNMEVEQDEYPLFKRPDGALLYVMTDSDGISFIISAGTPNWELNSEENEDPCFYNVLSGTMTPRNEEMTQFSFMNEETGCSLQFKFLNDAKGQRFEVNENDCGEEHIATCPSWNGTYSISDGE